jgi:CRISPR-associated protein Cmr1
MFGGGVEAGEPDPTLPIRGTSIRGQLQFWWRATCGAGCPAREELFARQTAVWGSTTQRSPVEVEVRDVKADRPTPCAEYKPKADGKLNLTWQRPFSGTALPYALFPFQGQLTPDRRREVEPPANYIWNATFTLRLRFPDALRRDVETAVWAWVNFGGLGARPRRGCGSLRCDELAPATPDKIGEWFTSAVGPGPIVERAWPTVPSEFLVRKNPGDALPVWDWLIGLFRHFRQGRGLGRNPGEGEMRPGRSRFPEPETIRRVMNTGSPRHEPQGWMPDGFPRAELGMPLLFPFKDERDGEPGLTTLYPYLADEVKDRMASPLILKPLALQNGQAVPLILPLVTPGIRQVELQDADRNCRTPQHAVPVQSPDFAAYTDSPFKGRSATGSAVEAFLALARQRENDFVEVTR